MRLRILYTNTLKSGAPFYVADINKRARQIFSDAQEKYFVKFGGDKESELVADVPVEEIRNLCFYLGNAFANLNGQFKEQAPQFSENRAGSCMKMHTKRDEIFCEVLIFNTLNDRMNVTKIDPPQQDFH